MSIEAVNSAMSLNYQGITTVKATPPSEVKKNYSPNDFYVKPGLKLEKNDEFINKIIFSHVSTEEKVTANNKRKIEIRPDSAIKIIDGTKQAITIAKGISGFTGIEEMKGVLSTSDGALSLSKGIINLADIDSEENKTKVVLESASNVAGGIGVILSQIDIPGAEFVTLAGRALGFGVQQQNLAEQIDKKSVRGITETSVGIVKSGWGVTLSGVKAAKIAASMGQSVGKVSTATVVKVSGTADKVSSYASKIAIPFAVAGTGFRLWDYLGTNKKVAGLENDLEKSNFEGTKEEAEKKISVLKTTANVQAVSFGLSAISTAALIASVVHPPSKAITAPLAIGTSILSSVAGSFSNENLRNTVVNGAESVINIKNDIKNKAMFGLARIIDNVIQ